MEAMGFIHKNHWIGFVASLVLGWVSSAEPTDMSSSSSSSSTSSASTSSTLSSSTATYPKLDLSQNVPKTQEYLLKEKQAARVKEIEKDFRLHGGNGTPPTLSKEEQLQYVNKFKNEHGGLDPDQFVEQKTIDPIKNIKKDNLLPNGENVAKGAGDLAGAVQKPDAVKDPILTATKNTLPANTPNQNQGNVQTYNLAVNKNQAGQAVLSPETVKLLNDSLNVLQNLPENTDKQSKGTANLGNDARLAYLAASVHQFSKTTNEECHADQTQIGKTLYNFEYINSENSKDKIIAVTPYTENKNGDLTIDQKNTIWIVPTPGGEKEGKSVIVVPEFDKNGNGTLKAYDYKIQTDIYNPAPFSGVSGDYSNLQKASTAVTHTENTVKGAPQLQVNTTSPIKGAQIPTSMNITTQVNKGKVVLGLNAETQIGTFAYGASPSSKDQIQLVMVSAFTKSDLQVGANWSRKLDNPMSSAGLIIVADPTQKSVNAQGYLGTAKVQIEKNQSEQYGKTSISYSPQIVTPNSSTHMTFVAFVSKEATGGNFNIQQQSKNQTYGASGSISTTLNQPSATVSAGGFVNARTQKGDVSFTGNISYNSNNSTVSGSYQLVYKKDEIQIFQSTDIGALAHPNSSYNPPVRLGFLWTPSGNLNTKKKLIVF